MHLYSKVNAGPLIAVSLVILVRNQIPCVPEVYSRNRNGLSNSLWMQPFVKLMAFQLTVVVCVYFEYYVPQFDVLRIPSASANNSILNQWTLRI